ncbi:hypothetical protein BDF21DRAFT_409311 [Thamnidium elegans]|nr:hypothetical protein BDF21DRAFT_409311 [Thamnidium elegans]
MKITSKGQRMYDDKNFAYIHTFLMFFNCFKVFSKLFCTICFSIRYIRCFMV